MFILLEVLQTHDLVCQLADKWDEQYERSDPDYKGTNPSTKSRQTVGAMNESSLRLLLLAMNICDDYRHHNSTRD